MKEEKNKTKKTYRWLQALSHKYIYNKNGKCQATVRKKFQRSKIM